MRTLIVALIAVTGTFATARAADSVDRGGRIETEETTVEILRPHRGREIRTPEGFLRIEDGPDLDRSTGLGSFVTYHVPDADRAEVETPPPAPDGPRVAADGTPLRQDGMVDTSAPIPGPDPCRAQRGRYMRRVLAMSGVDVDHPIELLDGLAGPAGEGAGVLGTGFVTAGVDPLKPLAWDQELRSLGRELATCQERAAAARP